MELNFYKQPFKKDNFCDWVYDANNNFVFQFEGQFDKKGNYAKGYLELEQDIINSLNSKEKIIIPNFKLENLKNYGVLTLNNEPFITIRGWGNLTGVGAHNFDEDKAAKIQDDFQEWLLYKLN